jgi:hypothetical protein
MSTPMMDETTLRLAIVPERQEEVIDKLMIASAGARNRRPVS